MANIAANTAAADCSSFFPVSTFLSLDPPLLGLPTPVAIMINPTTVPLDRNALVVGHLMSAGLRKEPSHLLKAHPLACGPHSDTKFLPC